MFMDTNMSIYLSRFFVGIGNGILLSSVYSVEIATPEKRGSVVMVSTFIGNPLHALREIHISSKMFIVAVLFSAHIEFICNV